MNPALLMGLLAGIGSTVSGGLFKSPKEPKTSMPAGFAAAAAPQFIPPSARGAAQGNWPHQDSLTSDQRLRAIEQLRRMRPRDFFSQQAPEVV